MEQVQHMLQDMDPTVHQQTKYKLDMDQLDRIQIKEEQELKQTHKTMTERVNQ